MVYGPILKTLNTSGPLLRYCTRGPGAHPEIFKRGGFYFQKTNLNPIVVSLFQPLMKTHAMIVKHGFAVIVAFCYNISLLRNPVITILKVVGCEDCVRENKSPLWAPGGEDSCNFFRKKNSHFNAIWITYCRFLVHLEKS